MHTSSSKASEAVRISDATQILPDELHRNGKNVCSKIQNIKHFSWTRAINWDVQTRGKVVHSLYWELCR